MMFLIECLLVYIPFNVEEVFLLYLEVINNLSSPIMVGVGWELVGGWYEVNR